jgi:ParB family chromosome partitioning protein
MNTMIYESVDIAIEMPTEETTLEVSCTNNGDMQPGSGSSALVPIDSVNPREADNGIRGTGKEVHLISTDLISLGNVFNRSEQPLSDLENRKLRASINASNGNTQPVVLVPIPEKDMNSKRYGEKCQFILVSGARRFSACIDLGFPVRSLIDYELEGQEVLFARYFENACRRGLSPWELGCLLQCILKEGGYASSKRKLAEKLGRNVSEISRALKIANLPQVVLDCFPIKSKLRIMDGERLDKSITLNKSRVLARAESLLKLPSLPDRNVAVEFLLTGLEERNNGVASSNASIQEYLQYHGQKLASIHWKSNKIGKISIHTTASESARIKIAEAIRLILIDDGNFTSSSV